MPLQKQTIPIAFADGIDTKTAAKQVLPGKLSVLNNGIFTNVGALNKRNGYTELPNTITPSGTITSAQAVTTYRDELVLFDGYSLFSYLPSQEDWIDRGTAISAITTNTQVLRNSYEQLNPDMGTLSGVQCFAWEDSRSDVRYSFRDATTGAMIIDDTELASEASYSPSQPKVLPFSGYFAVLYADNSNNAIRCTKLDPTSPGLTSDFQVVSDGYDGSTTGQQVYDACVIGSNLYVAYGNNAGHVAIVRIDSSYSVHSGTTISKYPERISINGDPSGNTWVAFYCADGSIYAAAYNGTGFSTVVAAKTVVSAPPAIGTLNNIHIAPQSANTGYMQVYYEENSSTYYDTWIGTNTITVTGSVGTKSTLVRSVGMAGKVYSYGGYDYLPLAYQSTLQSTYFVMRTDGAIISKINQGNGGGLRDNSMLAETQSLGNGLFTFANCVNDSIIAEAGIVFSLLGVNYTLIDHTSPNAFVSTQVGNNLLITGGVVQGYDGVNLTEFGFHLYPENVSYTSNWMLVSETVKGDSSHYETSLISVGASGATFVGGSYITWSTTTTNYAVWWTVNGVGTAPTITNTTVVGPAALLSSDSATNVATKITAAMTGSGFTATSNFNSITLTNTSHGAVTATAMTVGANGVYNGNGIADGYYQYCTVFEWPDNFGQVQRSAPSIPVTVTVPPTGMTVSIVAPTLRLTSKPNVTIVVYRTQNNGTIFYRLTSSIEPLYNSTTADNVSYIDSLPDSALISNELLYTTGDVLENIAPPGGMVMTTYRNRAWLGGLDDPNTVWFSKVLNDLTNLTTIPIEFSDTLTLSLDARGGAISAFGVLDDKLIIFKESAIFEIAGDGPDATGNNSDYGDPVVLSSTVGCTDPNSVVITPNGIMFKTAYGIYLLDRSGQTQYTGAPVEAYNYLTITSATVLNDQQVIFTSSDGYALVYDYYFDKWSVFTNYAAVDSALYDSSLVMVRSNGLALQSSVDTFTDNGTAISMQVTTGWLSLAGLQGYQRIYALYLLGTFKSNHELTVSVAYDFDETFRQTSVIDTSSVDLTNPYQFRVFLTQQRCQAIKISIADSPESPYGEGYSIDAITLQVGVKQGPTRMPAGKSFA